MKAVHWKQITPWRQTGGQKDEQTDRYDLANSRF